MSAADKRLLKVKVESSAKTESLREHGDNFTVCVREPAANGRANRRVLQLLAARFGTAVRLRLVSGHHRPSKIVSVETSSRKR